METLLIGDHVYDELNDKVMVVEAVDNDTILCTWRDDDGKLYEDHFALADLKKMSVGGVSSSREGRIDPGAQA